MQAWRRRWRQTRKVTTMRPDHARDIRNALVDPWGLCEKLGLTRGAKRQAGRGALVCCPVHGERDPSCSVTVGPDGTIRVRCFACDFSGDALGLVAQVRGLSTRTAFAEVLAEAAELAGLISLAYDLRQGRPPREYEPPPPPEPRPEPEYPPGDEVQALWESAGPVSRDQDCAATLIGRRIDPSVAREQNLVRAIGRGSAMPPWATKGGRSWLETGHRILLRVWDASGVCRSVRAWRTKSGDETLPKRLPPAGRRSSGLVLANRPAVGMLLGRTRPREVVIVEGEPDWLVWSTRDPGVPVVGVGSGWWTAEHAARIPNDADVWIRTHTDAAGERYAAHVAETIGDRCAIWRKRAA